MSVFFIGPPLEAPTLALIGRSHWTAKELTSARMDDGPGRPLDRDVIDGPGGVRQLPRLGHNLRGKTESLTVLGQNGLGACMARMFSFAFLVAVAVGIVVSVAVAMFAVFFWSADAEAASLIALSPAAVHCDSDANRSGQRTAAANDGRYPIRQPVGGPHGVHP